MRADRDDIDDVEPALPPAYFYTGPRKDVVVLTADEAKDDLPAVCLCCGARATVWKRKLFAVNEVGAHVGTGIGALIALIFLLVDVIRVAGGLTSVCVPRSATGIRITGRSGNGSSGAASRPLFWCSSS
jgi:hypothetical protein